MQHVRIGSCMGWKRRKILGQSGYSNREVDSIPGPKVVVTTVTEDSALQVTMQGKDNRELWIQPLDPR